MKNPKFFQQKPQNSGPAEQKAGLDAIKIKVITLEGRIAERGNTISEKQIEIQMIKDSLEYKQLIQGIETLRQRVVDAQNDCKTYLRNYDDAVKRKLEAQTRATTVWENLVAYAAPTLMLGGAAAGLGASIFGEEAALILGIRAGSIALGGTIVLVVGAVCYAIKLTNDARRNAKIERLAAECTDAYKALGESESEVKQTRNELKKAESAAVDIEGKENRYYTLTTKINLCEKDIEQNFTKQNELLEEATKLKLQSQQLEISLIKNSMHVTGKTLLADQVKAISFT